MQELAGEVAARLPGWRIRAATMAAKGEIERRLEGMTAAPLVYPLFMSDGWFTETALPRRLKAPGARILAPFGLDEALPALASASLTSLARDKDWAVEETEILVAAHGSASGRENPARRTERFAEALARLAPWRRIQVGFLEQEPQLSAIAATCAAQTICLPFFAAGGHHVTGDVPEDLAAGGFPGVIAAPLGRAPYTPRVIADALRKAAREAA